MFCYKTNNTFMKRAQEEWEHDIVYDPQKVTGSLEVNDLLYDSKSRNALCGRFDLVYDHKRSWVH